MPNTIIPVLRQQFHANIATHASAFIINIAGYIITANPIFIWIQMAALSFIGIQHTKSNKFFDQNLLNHFTAVVVFYILSIPLGKYHETYFLLIMIFTYMFFVLRNNGFDKSLNPWMFIQALLIGTTLPDYPMENKIFATAIAYLETQILLNISFKAFPNNLPYIAEANIIKLNKISADNWLNYKNQGIRLAIRGAITATILYAICISIHDIKPNWAVAAAVSCLIKNDDIASMRTIKALIIGAIAGGIIAQLIHPFMIHHIDITIIGIWLCMILGLACSLENSINPNLYMQAIGGVFLLIATSFVAISLGVNNIDFTLLKVENTLMGAITGLISLHLWKKIKKIIDEVEV